jgi:broad specificity phosphatase PhoE
VGKRTWRRLADTGPGESFPALMARLAALPADAKRQRHIDVFVVTHSLANRCPGNRIA